MSEKMLVNNFERIESRWTAESIANTSIELGRVAMQFARVERAPRYEDSSQESDVEHSYMLALTAPELARSLEYDLDLGLISQFAIVHDLIELKTSDVATLMLNDEQLHQKELFEKRALEALLNELPPYTARLLERYEHQEEPEARFVRFVDKLLPLVVDILGDGNRVIKDDYGISSKAELEHIHATVHERFEKKFGAEYPEISSVHAELVRKVESVIEFDA